MKKYLMVDDYTLNNALDKIKRIDIEKLYDAKILIDADDELPDVITFKNAVILMACVFKYGDEFYSQLFLFTQRKAFRKDLSKELMLVAWHRTRW